MVKKATILNGAMMTLIVRQVKVFILDGHCQSHYYAHVLVAARDMSPVLSIRFLRINSTIGSLRTWTFFHMGRKSLAYTEWVCLFFPYINLRMLVRINADDVNSRYPSRYWTNLFILHGILIDVMNQPVEKTINNFPMDGFVSRIRLDPFIDWWGQGLCELEQRA